MVYNTKIIVDKRLLPFIQKGSQLKVSILDVLSGEGLVQIDLKPGVTPDMFEAIGPVSIFVDLSESAIIDGANSASKNEIGIIKPALPVVNNEYEEIRNKMSETTVDRPVQTLFSGGDSDRFQDQQHEVVAKKEVVPTKVFTPATKVSPRAPESVPAPAQVKTAAKVVEPSSNPSLSPDVVALMQQVEAMKNMMQNMMLGSPKKQNKGGGEESDQAVEAEDPGDNLACIMSVKELMESIDSVDTGNVNVNMSKDRMSRQEATEIERFRLPRPAYVVSNVGILFLEDVGVSIRPSQPCNLSSVSIFKLKKSNDLIRSLNSGKIKFVDYKTAKEMVKKSDLTSIIEGRDGKLKAFVGGDAMDRASDASIDVTGDGSDESESYTERMASSKRTKSDRSYTVDEDDVFNEQDDLINLTGSSDFDDEDRSDAVKASIASKQIRTSNRKSISRLDD